MSTHLANFLVPRFHQLSKIQLELSTGGSHQLVNVSGNDVVTSLGLTIVARLCLLAVVGRPVRRSQASWGLPLLQGLDRQQRRPVSRR